MSVNTSYTSSAYSPIKRRVPNWPHLHPAVWAFAVLVAIGSWVFLPQGGFDWHNDIGRAARHWWPAPWREGLPLLPWAAMLLSPLGGLPDRVATALTNSASVILLALVVRHLGGPDWLAIFLLLTPFGFFLFNNGQTDVLILSGLLFFNGFDLLVLALKPQVALGVMVARLQRAHRDKVSYLLPLGMTLLVSLVVWWAWPLGLWSYAPLLIPSAWNLSTWPYGIPLGLLLIWLAWKTGDDRWGIVASPLLFPYINWPSYLGLVAVLGARWPRWTVVVWVAVYAVFGIGLIISRNLR